MDVNVVVVLPIVADHLPIGLVFPFHFARVTHGADIGIVHEVEERLQMLFDSGRFAAEVDEDPVAPDGTTHAYQAERLLV